MKLLITSRRGTARFFGPLQNYKATMAAIQFILLFATVFITCEAQRPFYAGLRPIGYPLTASNDILLNRFGEDEPAPIEARGDGSLINRLNQMPIDNRPFWYLNWQAYDALRSRPQTWPQRPNNFISRF
ncbi:unnamed protein product [Parnassius apollo]|uniref:(apollo) hypothetical protein n=1 Tax=Parnassius apollo TaxID=110799 RepID=A0A8S3XM70_PARAO|nr:unnamed protein product [Parnassius apollo]